MRKRSWTKIQLITAAKNSISVREVLIALNLKPTGGNYKQLYRYMKEYNIDYSHFLGKGYLRGKKNIFIPKLDLKEILIENSNYGSSNSLRKRLINEGIFIKQCSICRRKTWLGKPISLELDHINGINTDNRINNLRIICPNCHAQTTNYRGKNKGKH
jgi:hypothetical protein